MAALVTLALLGILLTAALLVVFNGWRLALLLLALQYGLVALLFGQIVIWQVALVKGLVGWLVVGILALTVRAIESGRPAARPTAPALGPLRIEFPTNFSVRLLATVMVVMAVLSLSLQPDFALPGLSPVLNFASYVLLGLGVLNLGLTEEPLNVGWGLLTLLSGFELAYAALEPSLAVTALLAAVNFGISMATSYLALLRHAPKEMTG